MYSYNNTNNNNYMHQMGGQPLFTTTFTLNAQGQYTPMIDWRVSG
jgi:hypothetical protein